MKAFRLVLVVMFVLMFAYTAKIMGIYGLNFLPYAVITGWQGQFNYDFSCYLVLSVIWIVWRHKFSVVGIFLGLIASVGGILFLAPYLFIMSLLTKGDIKELLIGKNR